MCCDFPKFSRLHLPKLYFCVLVSNTRLRSVHVGLAQITSKWVGAHDVQSHCKRLVFISTFSKSKLASSRPSVSAAAPTVLVPLNNSNNLVASLGLGWVGHVIMPSTCVFVCLLVWGNSCIGPSPSSKSFLLQTLRLLNAHIYIYIRRNFPGAPSG